MVDNLITICDENGKEFDMKALGLTGLKLQIPSPSYRTVTKELEGLGGSIVLDRVLDVRNLTASFYSKGGDYIDSLIVRDRLYKLLGVDKPLYVSESKFPNKRWKVYLDPWTPERLDIKHHSFDIPMISYLGTSESKWVNVETFNSPNFRFNNRGDQTIDPRIHSETEITISGTLNNPTIRNLTTGDEWSWNGSTVQGDTILLKGVRSLKNGQSIFGQTNKKLITIDPGWNMFEIIGAHTSVSLKISTRFYYL